MFPRTLLVACVLMLSVVVIAADAPPKNLITNGSVEEGPGVPADWWFGAKPEGGFKVSVAGEGRTGSRSLLVAGEGDWGVATTNRVTIDRKQRYRGVGYIKVEGDGAKATLKFDYYDESNNWVGSSHVGDLTPADKGWQPVSLTDKAHEHLKAKFIALSTSITGKGKAYYDDLTLTAAPLTDNLLGNGSFEDVVGSKASGWWSGQAEGGTSSAKISTEKPKDGARCLHLTGNAEWAVANGEHVPFDKTKTYTVTGFVRVKSGNAQIKIDYFQGNEWIGSTFGEDVSDADWTEKTVTSTDEFAASATHLAATMVGTGEFEAWFDAVTMTAK